VPLGDCIGWVEGEDLYLEPAASFRAVQVALRDTGEDLAITEQTLRKRLQEKGLLVSVDKNRETLTTRKSIAGSTKSVLHLSRALVIPEGSESEEGL
jgi:hypothetical protein